MSEPINNHENDHKERPRIKPPAIRPRPPRDPKFAENRARSASHDNIPRPPRLAPKEPGTVTTGRTIERRYNDRPSDTGRPRQLGAPTHVTTGTGTTRPGGAMGDRPRGRRPAQLGHNGEKRPGELPRSSDRKFGVSHGPHPSFPEDDMPREKIAPPNTEALRLVPLGGLEEVGRNCSFIEYKNEIVIIDMRLPVPRRRNAGHRLHHPERRISRKEKSRTSPRSF